MIVRLILLLCFVAPLNAAAQSATVNFPLLIESAEYANAAYEPEAVIVELLGSGDYSLTRYHVIPENQVSYFIATNDLTKTQVITVRGTANVENSIVNISLKLTLDRKTGLSLHDGFSSAAKKIYSDMQPYLEKGYTINTTGHSLGGAVALIVAKYLQSDSYKVGQVITFGQPKVTNRAGAKSFSTLKITRVVTALDVVPLVPLFDPLDINNIDIFWHSGQEVLLLDGPKYSLLEGMDSMLRATKFTQKVVSGDNLENHKMAYYLALLNKKKLSSQQVVYKNDFNLFNLFSTE